MSNRREFLVAAAAAVPAVVVAPSILASASFDPRPRDGAREVLTALVDERYRESRLFGQHFRSARKTVRTTPRGDLTQVWLGYLRPVWAREPLAIAGLTPQAALFCLEQLATSHALRVVFHGEHIVHPGGWTEHSLLRGAEAAHVTARDLERAGSRWPGSVARALADYSLGSVAVPRVPSDAALDPPLPPGARLLTSWVIAAPWAPTQGA